MNCRQFAEVHPVHPRQAQLRWPRFQSHKSNLDPGNPRMHSSKSAWLPDTLSSIRVFAGKMSLDVFGQTWLYQLYHVFKGRLSKVLPECVARVPISLWGSLGVEGVFARRCATVRTRAAPVFFPASPAFSGLSGSVPLRLLHEVPRKFSWILRCSSTCPILPQCVLQMSSRAMDTEICCHGLHMS